MRTIVSRFFRSPFCSNFWSAAKASDVLVIVNYVLLFQDKAGSVNDKQFIAIADHKGGQLKGALCFASRVSFALETFPCALK